MKELELEDRQYDIDRELADLSTAGNLTKTELDRFEALCELKVKIVEERNEIVMQTEDERMRCVECGVCVWWEEGGGLSRVWLCP